MSASEFEVSGWAVIGGGMLGLTLALRLAQHGQAVVVYDSASTLGGLTSTSHFGEITWDRYYHVISSNDLALITLLDELELSPQIRWGSTKTNFYDGKDLFPLNNVFDYLRLPALRAIDKLRLAINILYAATINSGAALESISAEQWLSRWSGQRAYRELWRPLLKSKLGTNHERASAAYIWSVIRRFYGARRGTTRTEQYGYIKGGYAHVIDALLASASRAGVQFKTGAPVQSIVKDQRSLVVETSNSSTHFDKVIFTGAAHLATRVCKDLGVQERVMHDNILYQGVVCSSVLLKKPLGGAYMTYITDDSIPFTTIIEMSSLTGTESFGGRHLCYLPRYLPSDDPMFERSTQNIETDFLAGLQRMFPYVKADDIETIQTTKTRHVLAIPTLHYTNTLPPIETSVPGLYICNSAQIINAALAVNESIELADNFATAVLASTK